MALIDISPEITRIISLETTLANVGGDPELLREIMDFFVELAPGQIDDLTAALQAGDVATVTLQAHGMKGGASNVGAQNVAATARELELLAKGGSLVGAESLVERLRADYAELVSVLPLLDWSKLD